MRQKTEYKLPSNSRWIGEARGHTREQLLSQAACLQAREDLEDEDKVLPAKIRQIHGGQ
jgi:hypothetical protein